MSGIALLIGLVAFVELIGWMMDSTLNADQRPWTRIGYVTVLGICLAALDDFGALT